ncbi:MAG: hypothetical protein QHH75_04750 [Bacillota bacterium]|nr:hypothetical protein [Bacillota bacterium]
MDSSLVPLLLITFFAERLVEIAKRLIAPLLGSWPEASRHALWQALGLAAGVILAFGMHINFLNLIGVTGAPWLGKLLAGLFAGMGSQWVHEIISNLPHDAARNFRAQAKFRDRAQRKNK